MFLCKFSQIVFQSYLKMTLRLIDDVVNVISYQMLSVVPFAAVICFGKLQRLYDICKSASTF